MMITDSEFSDDLTNILSTISIFECFHGSCIKTSGYLKYGSSNNNIVKCDLSSCDITNNKYICNEFNIGIAFYDDELGFVICINDGTYDENNYILKNIEKKDFIFNYKSIDNYYNLYISSENGNVIGLSLLGKNLYYLINKIK